MEAAKRAEVGKSEREALARSLQRDRRAKKLHERIAWLQQRALVAQSQRAVQVRATDAKSAEGRDQAPQCEGHDAIAYASAQQVAGEWKQIEALVEKLEGYWDAHDGIALKDVSMMTTDEKNALLLGPLLRGLSPEAIHGIYGDPIGKPRTIRFIRSEGGQTGRGCRSLSGRSVRREPVCSPAASSCSVRQAVARGRVKGARASISTRRKRSFDGRWPRDPSPTLTGPGHAPRPPWWP
jgi:hypothetical protein